MYVIIRRIRSISELHKNLPVVPFVTGLVGGGIGRYLKQIFAASEFSLNIVLFSLRSYLVVSVAFEAFLVFAVFCVIETLLGEAGLVAVFPVIGVVVEEAASVVFPSIIVFAEDVLDILFFRWQIVNLPFVSVVFSPV